MSRFELGSLVLQVHEFKVVDQVETRGCRNCDVQLFGGRPTLVRCFIHSADRSRPCLGDRRFRGRVFCSTNLSIRMPSCSCKVGACREPGCKSECKRCGCGCDGVSPEDALARTRGRKHKKSKLVEPVERARKLRKTASVASVKIATDTAMLNAKDKEEEEEVITIKSLWRIFDFPESLKKNLPSKVARDAGTVHTGSSKGMLSTWACLVQTLLTIATICAQVLYPGAYMALLEAVALKILGRKDPETELLRAAERIAMVIAKAPKASIQGRVARACAVKAFPSFIITKLKKSGKLSVVDAAKLNLTGEVQSRAYRDYNSMVEGVLLEKAEQSRKRYDENALRKAVKYMLLPSNVGALSWGTRDVRLSQNEVITLPTLVRRVTLEDMYKM